MAEDGTICSKWVDALNNVITPENPEIDNRRSSAKKRIGVEQLQTLVKN